MSRFQKIDEITISDHFYLDLREDRCWFLFNYTANVGFSHSSANSLIQNLKKDVSLKGTSQYQYKEQAIIKAAQYLADMECDNVTFVPIPPSKCKGDKLYDDRITRILKTAFSNNSKADIRELILQKNSTEASHKSQVRPNPSQIIDNLMIDVGLAHNLRSTICLVDDVITTGSHFVASKKIIKRNFPNIDVIGIFIARRAIS